MNKIALLGTSADPPPAATGPAQRTAAAVPAGGHLGERQPQGHGAPLALRAELLQALVEQISDPRLELTQALSDPFTIRTLERARARWPRAELVFVGSDLAVQIPSWKQSDQWLPHCRLAIAQRRVGR